MTETKKKAVRCITRHIFNRAVGHVAKIKRVEISSDKTSEAALDRLADFMEKKVDDLRNGQDFEIESWILEDVESSGLDCLYDDAEPLIDDYYIVPKENTLAVALVDQWFTEFLTNTSDVGTRSRLACIPGSALQFEGVMCTPVI